MSGPNDITYEACGHHTVHLDGDQPSLPWSDREAEFPPDRKAVLFCPSCGHESAIEGDWIVHAGIDQHSLECPNCEYIVTERSQSDAPCF